MSIDYRQVNAIEQAFTAEEEEREEQNPLQNKKHSSTSTSSTRDTRSELDLEEFSREVSIKVLRNLGSKLRTLNDETLMSFVDGDTFDDPPYRQDPVLASEVSLLLRAVYEELSRRMN